VGDLPTRFKYTSVPNDTFGLDPVEILRATDAELNSYVGLRQFAPYKEGKKRWDNSRNERLQEFRGALAARGVDARPSKRQRDDGVDGEQPVKRRKGKKERMKAKAAQAAKGEVEAEEE
jgi:protein KRI1